MYDNITALNDDRIKIIRTFTVHASTYYSLIENSVAASDPSARKTTTECLQSLDQLKLTAPTAVLEYSALYSVYDEIDSCMQKISKVLENPHYAKILSVGMSTTYTLNVLLDRNRALDALEKYTALAKFDNVVIDAFLSSVDTSQLLEYVFDCKCANKFYIRSVNKLLSEVAGSRRERLQRIVEEQKDHALGSARVDLRSQKGVMNTVVSYDLRPLSEFLAVSDILQRLDVHYSESASIFDNLKNITKKHGLIVVSNGNSSPLEYDLRGLIDAEYIAREDIDTSRFSGITKKLIKRYQTIKQVGGGKAGKTLVLPHKSHTWIVLQTYNGRHYRLLGRDNVLTDHDVYGLINGLSTRAQNYHDIVSARILESCFDKSNKLIFSDFNDTKQIVTNSDPLKSKLVKLLVATELPSAGFKYQHDAKVFFANERQIAPALVSVLSDEYGISQKTPPEYMLSHLVKFDAAIREFCMEVEKQWSKEQDMEGLFPSKGGNALLTKVANIYNRAANAMDASGMWTSYENPIKEFYMERQQYQL